MHFFEFAIKRSEISNLTVHYSLSDEARSFIVPKIDSNINILYMSCNKKYVEGVWETINFQHKEKPYHICIGGGDQVSVYDNYLLYYTQALPSITVVS